MCSVHRSKLNRIKKMITAIDNMAYQCTHNTSVYIIRLPDLLQNTYAIKNKSVLLMLIIYFFLVCSTSCLLTQKKTVLYNILPLKLYWAIQSSSYSHKAISLRSSKCSNNLKFLHVKTLHLLVKPSKLEDHLL